MTESPVVILPGIYNSGPTHWQTLWEQAEPTRFRRFAPTRWDHPQRADWIAAFQIGCSSA